MREKIDRARRGDREEVREKEVVRSMRWREERERKACTREVLGGDKKEGEEHMRERKMRREREAD